jgi:tight adherence protein B
MKSKLDQVEMPTELKDRVVQYFLGILFFIGLIIFGWFFRGDISVSISIFESAVLGISAGCFLLLVISPVIEMMWGKEHRLAWRRRLEEREGIPTRPWTLGQTINTLYGELNEILYPIVQKGPSRILFNWWQDAGFGSQPIPLFGSLIGIVSLSSIAGNIAIGSRLLSGYFSILLLIGFLSFLCIRAKGHRQLFHDQFPGVLERLADSLQAGFSLSQAIEFMAPNLSEPSASEMTRIFTQIQIGFSVEQALMALYRRRPDDDVKLLVEGINLQRQTGGNMIEMVRDIAGLVRERVELGKEIRTMTSQGRLSAVVIALLVPVSLGILSMFPGYTEVLFETTIGNLVLISAGILELIGALIVIRLVRIEV